MTTNKAYPRLFYIDLIDADKVVNNSMTNLRQISSPTPSASGRDSRASIKSAKTRTASNKTEQDKLHKCLKPMCENEEGWHPVSSYIPVDNLDPNFHSYLARMMHILKYSHFSTELNVFLMDQGIDLLAEIDSYLNDNQTEPKSLNNEKELSQSYVSIRNYFIAQTENHNLVNTSTAFGEMTLGLQRCELKNGKMLWLCKRHIESNSARILNDTVETNFSYADTINTKLSIISELDSTKLDII